MHTVELGNRIVEFRFITMVSNISEIMNDDYIFIVQNEDVLDVWRSKDRVRGSNDIVRYYETWYEWEFDETDFIILTPRS